MAFFRMRHRSKVREQSGVLAFWAIFTSSSRWRRTALYVGLLLGLGLAALRAHAFFLQRYVCPTADLSAKRSRCEDWTAPDS